MEKDQILIVMLQNNDDVIFSHKGGGFMSPDEQLIPPHGGYRNLKSFQMAQLVHDMTARFVERYIDPYSRTRDQMVQAARSGVQNIAEGSQFSATSKKMELKLTSAARSSLEELRLDYEDFLRQRNLPMLEPRDPVLERFKRRRCSTLEQVQVWAAEEVARGATARTNTDGHGPARTSTDKHGAARTGPDKHGAEPTSRDRGPGGPDAAGRQSSPVRVPSVPVRVGPCSSVPQPVPQSVPLPPSALAANAALSLINLACWLLDRQIAAQARAFEKEGGFTERLYRIRSQRRRKSPEP